MSTGRLPPKARRAQPSYLAGTDSEPSCPALSEHMVKIVYSILKIWFYLDSTAKRFNGAFNIASIVTRGAPVERSDGLGSSTGVSKRNPSARLALAVLSTNSAGHV